MGLFYINNATKRKKQKRKSGWRETEAQYNEWLNSHGVVNPALHLAHTGGAPLAAMDDAAAEWLPARKNFLEHIAEPVTLDVLKLSAELDKAKLDTDLVIAWLQKWIYDLISLGLAQKIRYYPDWHDALPRLAPHAHAPLTRQLGASSLLFRSRSGWSRLLF